MKPREFKLIEFFNSQHGHYYEPGDSINFDLHLVESWAYHKAIEAMKEALDQYESKEYGQLFFCIHSALKELGECGVS